jgi:hypothetical protein
MFDTQIITITFFISAFGVIILNFAEEKIKAQSVRAQDS